MEPTESISQMGEIDENFPIEVAVSNPRLKGEGMGAFIVFTIKGKDQNGEFEVERRYNDFHLFRSTLSQKWPGCFIPAIPSKQWLGNKEPAFVEERRRFLQYFCIKLTERKYLYYSQEGLIFFRSKSSDLELLFNKIPKFNIKNIIENYKKTFAFLSGKEINTELILKINGFKNFLDKTAKSNLDNMKNFSKTLLTAKKVYNEQYGSLLTCVLPNYEKNCVAEYISQGQNNLLFQSNDLVKQGSEQIVQLSKTNNFELFYDFIQLEYKEVKAFLESIQTKDLYNAKKEKLNQKIQDLQSNIQDLINGKFSLKQIFSTSKKELQIANLEKEQQACKSEMEEVNVIIDLMHLIIGYVEIDRFKIEKQQRYYELLIALSQREQQLNQRYQDLWKQVQGSQFLDQ